MIIATFLNASPHCKNTETNADNPAPARPGAPAVAGDGPADHIDSVVRLLGRQLFSEPLSGTDSDYAESLRARSHFGIGRGQRGDGGGFLSAQAPGNRAAELARGLHSSTMVLCYVTDRHLLAKGERAGAQAEELARHIARAAAAGVDWIQIREKDLPARELVELARAAVADAKRTGSGNRVIVNDRIDVALAAEASGVHLSADSVPLEAVIPWLRNGNAPEGFLVGISCHELSEVVAAEKARASYVIFGPVFETPSKKSFGPPQGIHKLATLCKAVRIPVVAIGGITEETAGECVRAGAAGIAAIRMFQQARDPESLGAIVSRLRKLGRGSTAAG